MGPKLILLYPTKCYFTLALDSRYQTHYPRVFVDKNTVDRGKTRNEAHRTDLKNVELIMYKVHLHHIDNPLSFCSLLLK